MTTLFLILFLLSAIPVALLALYPVFSHQRAFWFPDPVKKDPAFRPPISIVMACYNEERYIRERLEMLLDPDEWIPGSELLIVSTGSTDGTNAILEHFRHREGVRLFLEKRITKIEALNLAFRYAQHDYLVFSDCRQYMRKGSVAQLVANLNDERVGTVTCTILDTRERPSFFRRLYRQIARWDSLSGSTFNLYGALYAQRRDTFRPIPEHLLFDDFFAAVSTLSQGKRLIQEDNAVLYDVPFPRYYNRERIERLARGLMIFLFSNTGLLRQIPFALRMQLLVYKYVKLFLLLLLPPAFLCSLFLFPDILLQPVPLVIAGGMLAGLLLVPRIRKTLWLFVRIQFFFGTALIGFVFFNRRSKHWEPLSIRRRKWGTRELGK